MLDNECPKSIKKHSREQKLKLGLAPTYVHRKNATEATIKIHKDHFIAGLCSVDPTFPMHLCCRLIPLATTTLNLLITERINPRILSKEILNGVFDCNRIPVAPPGAKVIVHEISSKKETCKPHGNRVGIYILHNTITGAIKHISRKQQLRESLIQLIFTTQVFTPKSTT